MSGLNDTELRSIALDHAVRWGSDYDSPDVVVEKADKYLAFLKGDKTKTDCQCGGDHSV